MDRQEYHVAMAGQEYLFDETEHLISEIEMGAGVVIAVNSRGMIVDLHVDNSLFSDTDEMSSVIMSAYASARRQMDDMIYEDVIEPYGKEVDPDLVVFEPET